MKPFKLIKLPNCETIESHISADGYKCVNYGDIWYAYFLPANWKNFGNSCSKTNSGHSVEYASLEQAQAACKKHFETFGPKPSANQRI